MTTTYQPGDEIQINGETVILTTQRFGRTPKFSWYSPAAGEGGEVAYPTIEQAVDHAFRTLGSGECRHGELQFCPDCHDQEN